MLGSRDTVCMFLMLLLMLCLWLIPPDHLVHQAHVDDHQAHEDNHQAHKDDHQVQEGDHQVHEDDRQVHEGDHQVHEDDRRVHEDDHWVHEDDHRVHKDDHWVQVDEHWVHVDDLLAHIEDHLSHAESNDHLVLLKNHQALLKNLQGERPIHLVLKNHLLILQSLVLIADHQVLTKNLTVHVGHLVQISYHQESPWLFVKNLVSREVPGEDHPDNGFRDHLRDPVATVNPLVDQVHFISLHLREDHLNEGHHSLKGDPVLLLGDKLGLLCHQEDLKEYQDLSQRVLELHQVQDHVVHQESSDKDHL